MEEPLITADECKTILKKISPTAKFFTHTIKSLAEEVEGYLSAHYALTIRYIENEQPKKKELFLKKQSHTSGFLSDMAKCLDVYVKENFVYNIYEELQKLKNFEPFAPKCYYFKEDLLVIDNLKYDDYLVTDRNVVYNLEECKVALKTLAFYHSSFIAYEEQKTTETGRLYRLDLEYPKEFEDKMFTTGEDTALGQFVASARNLIVDLLDVIQDNTIDKDSMKELVMKEKTNPQKLEFLERFRKCPLHIDLWSKNILFKKIDNVITDCRLIDFQLLRYFLPSYDVIVLLHYNTTYKFRQIHKEELIQFYYECLDTQLELFGVNCSKTIPYQDLLDGITICEPAAHIQAFNDNILLRLPESVLFEAMTEPQVMTDILTTKKSEYIIKYFNENHEIKQFVMEEVLELCDAFEQKQYYVKNNTVL